MISGHIVSLAYASKSSSVHRFQLCGGSSVFHFWGLSLFSCSSEMAMFWFLTVLKWQKISFHSINLHPASVIPIHFRENTFPLCAHSIWINQSELPQGENQSCRTHEGQVSSFTFTPRPNIQHWICPGAPFNTFCPAMIYTANLVNNKQMR